MEPETTAGPGGNEGSRFPAAFVVGLVVVFIVVACAAAVSRYAHSRESAAAAVKLPFGPTEQAYASNLHFGDIKMARATNLLNQEFTYVAGTMTNGGTRAVAALQVTIEFRDPFNQVILRDDESPIARTNVPLAAGDHRDFQITLEHIPVEWNQQNPTFRVTGLALQ